MLTEELRSKNLFKTENSSLALELIMSFEYPWQALEHIGELIREKAKELCKNGYDEKGQNVWISNTAKISPFAHIDGPCIIGAGTELRHGAFIRGNVIVGDGCVVGNSTELKGCILFDGVQVPHYNYVGDSILGYRAHMGAGAIASNVRGDKGEICVVGKKAKIHTGRRKLGAIVGDFGEIGCSSVLNPGTVVGREAMIYPLSCVRGYVDEGHIYKGKGETVKRV